MLWKLEYYILCQHCMNNAYPFFHNTPIIMSSKFHADDEIVCFPGREISKQFTEAVCSSGTWNHWAGRICNCRCIGAFGNVNTNITRRDVFFQVRCVAPDDDYPYRLDWNKKYAPPHSANNRFRQAQRRCTSAKWSELQKNWTANLEERKMMILLL